MSNPVWAGTQITTDVAGNAFPPLLQSPDSPSGDTPYPADEVLHVIRSLADLWLPPTWSRYFYAPHVSATGYNGVGEPWVFERQGVWLLRRIMLFPMQRRTAGQAFTTATYPSQVMVSLSAGEAMPFVLDSTHFDLRDLNLYILNGTTISVDNADTTNDGFVYMEFAEKVHT